MNMIIVANGGIICQGKKGAQTTISGSIYAGTITGETALAKEPDTSLWLQPDADLAITAGDKVVTENEIRADKGSSFAARTRCEPLGKKGFVCPAPAYSCWELLILQTT